MKKTAATRSTRPRVGERREQILAAALSLFARHGASGVSTRQIAQAVGISQPSLYAHFASADHIAEELCHRAFDALYAGMAEVLASQRDPRQRLDALGRAYIDFGLANPEMYRIAFMNPDPPGKDGVSLVALESGNPGLDAGLRAFGALHAVVAELRGTTDQASVLAAQSIWASVHGLTSLFITMEHFPWAERDALITFHLARCQAAVTMPAQTR